MKLLLILLLPFALLADDTIFVVCQIEAGVVKVVDPTLGVTATVSVGSFPQDIVIAPDGSAAYVTSAADNSVTVIDLTSDSYTTSTISSVGSSPIGITITADGSTLYVASSGDSTVVPIPTSTLTPGSAITVGGGGASPQFVEVTPDDTKVYVTLANGNMSYIDRSNSDSVTTFAVPNNAYTNGLAITPDGTSVYVTSGFDAFMYPITIPSTPRTRVASGTAGLLYVTADPTRDLVYSGSLLASGSGKVAPYSTVDDSLGTLIPIPNATVFGLEVTPDGTTLYLCGNETAELVPVTLADSSVGTGIALGASSPVRLAILSSTPLVTGTVSGTAEISTFFTQSEYYSTITWTDPNESTPDSYRIYRDSALTDLAGTVPYSDPKVFYDQNRLANTAYNYYVQALYSDNSTNTIGNVTVTFP